MSVIIDGADGLSRGGADLLYRGLPLEGGQWMDRFASPPSDGQYGWQLWGSGATPNLALDQAAGRRPLHLDAVAASSGVNLWLPPQKTQGAGLGTNQNEGVLLASKNPVMRVQMALQGGIGVADCQYRAGFYYFDGTTFRQALMKYLLSDDAHLTASLYDGAWSHVPTDYTPVVGREILVEIALDSTGFGVRVSEDGGRNWSTTARVAATITQPLCPYLEVENGANVGAVMDVYGWSVTQG